jgi:hypothetical protein
MAGPWFRPKRFGLGLTPSSWQGWLVTGTYVAVLILLGFTVAASQPWVFWTLFGLATVAYLLVAFLTRVGGR